MAALSELSDDELAAPSLLPGWSRLTIACHLRFGARTLLAMTADARAGREASYYPGGRDRQRPGTLEPEPGESPGAVVAALSEAAAALDEAWSGVGPAEWDVAVREPADNPDLGTVSLAHLPMSRLTEVEVHGVDLGIGLPDWSPWFVAVALPHRIWRLQLRTPSVQIGAPDEVSWLLAATDGPSYRVTVRGRTVQTSVAPTASSDDAAVVVGTSRDLLALLLGRPTLGSLATPGDDAGALSFRAYLPGP